MRTTGHWRPLESPCPTLWRGTGGPPRNGWLSAAPPAPTRGTALRQPFLGGPPTREGTEAASSKGRCEALHRGGKRKRTPVGALFEPERGLLVGHWRPWEAAAPWTGNGGPLEAQLARWRGTRDKHSLEAPLMRRALEPIT
jgi:hypothetical protein